MCAMMQKFLMIAGSVFPGWGAFDRDTGGFLRVRAYCGAVAHPPTRRGRTTIRSRLAG